MNAQIRLLASQVRYRPARTALTALAVVASSCIVVWVTSGYDALIAQSVDESAADSLGRFQLIITAESGGPGAAVGRPGGTGGPTRGRPGGRPPGGARPGGAGGPGSGPAELPRSLVGWLRRDRRVAEANLTTQSRVGVGRATPDPEADKLLRPDRPPVHGMPPLAPPLVGTDAAVAPYELTAGRWLDQEAAGRPEGVLSTSHAESLKVTAGDDVKVVSEVGEWTVRLVGIIAQPEAPGGGRRGVGVGAQSGIFVTLPFAEQVNGHASRVGRINLALAKGADSVAFRADLARKLADMKAPAVVTGMESIKETMILGLSQSGTKTLAYSATGIALMAALFIIFTTLSMSVSERARELAVLRAVGMTRGQVAGLVVLEGLFLAFLGWAGGLLAGWGLVFVVARAKPDLFTGGAVLGPWTVGLTAVAAVGGALAAAVVPAWRATRVTPLEAMAPPRPSTGGRWIGPMAAAGLALLVINPLLTYVPGMADETRVRAYTFAGYPGMVLGFVLLAPAVVVLVERLAGPMVARLLGLPPRLMRSLLSANLGRTAGTTIALTVGLGLYIATQTWGSSMLAPFLPGDWLPEMLVGFEPSGLPGDGVEVVEKLEGTLLRRALPMAVEQPALVEPTHGPGGFLVQQDNVVLVGLDPERAFGGADPMIDARFVEGDREAALARLKAGKACLVPDHFLGIAGLGLGDGLEMIPPGSPPGTVVSYEIVGTLSMPGWQWMTKMTGLRRRTTRTGALVLAPIHDVRRDFKVGRINFFWLDTNGRATAEEVEGIMQSVAEAHGASKFEVAGVGEVTSLRPYARLTSTQAVRDGIRWRADGMIWGMSKLPLVTLVITSLAVVNTVVSSVRARRWELGILRALGTTRWGLVRLILAESILIGLAVCALGVAFGLMAGWCGTGMARYLSPFGGMTTTLVLPWRELALGASIALGLCLAAGLWPAITTGRAEPLDLLRGGRAAA